MDNDYEMRCEKVGDNPSRYSISIETTNFACYKRLKEIMQQIVTEYEARESRFEKGNLNV